ncbi:multidrug effflux MFS transporter [Brachybacterium aquaticum]|uniref:DHA1 family bicyclomycin/chloramphenicol resistance-like MFS transporter n=1 Tax=Brachybacterium aquaticum TaxID=1432564 RepID=A0A841ADW2_9MICO|nr:multidrug effflux MFS transporter [Brachybacterium aquaticum]MBB5831472.1 DHA1 family bicyclomycin/chloramphenicol resistance-like MFS transporter [Brachybacterium aquaticum]
MAAAADDTPRDHLTGGAPAEPSRTTGEHLPVPTATGGIPTITGAIPVLEDPADQARAHLPTEEQLAGTRGKVTAMVIVVLTTLSAIGPLATDMYIPAFPQVASELGTTASMMQLTLTAFFMGTAGGQIVAGPLSDRLGRRGPLLIGITLCLLASIGCMLAPSAELLMIMRVLQGIGGGFGMVLGRAVLIDMTDGPELFRIMNVMQGVGGVAPIVAPLLGGLILLVGQWREIFAVIAVMSLLSLIGVLFLIPESLPVERRHSGGFRTFLSNCRTLLGRRIFVAYLLVNAFSAFALMAYVSASSFVVQEMLGYSSTTYSISFAINSMGMMALSLLSAYLTRTIHPRRLIRVGLIVVSLASFALLIGSLFLDTPAWIVFPAFFLTVAPQGMIFGNGGALASDQAREFAGTGSAMLGLGFSFAASIAAPLVGLAGTHSSLPMAIAMVAGSLISVFFFVLAGRGSGADDGRLPGQA